MEQLVLCIRQVLVHIHLQVSFPLSVLHVMPQCRQMGVLPTHFPRELGRGRAFADASKPPHPLRRPVARVGQRGVGVGVEHAPAAPALAVQHRGVAAAHAQSIDRPAMRGSRAAGVPQADHMIVTRLVVHEPTRQSVSR